ncbi:MAG: glycoside hydrolase family 16 protein, partial [Kaistella sp.]
MFNKKIYFVLMLVASLSCFAQVDVVYNDLVWADEFSGTGAINQEKWHHQTQLPNGSSWYNGEQQHYTNRTDNSSVNNGSLSITAKRESFTDQNVTKNFTSARLNSKFAFKYGRVDVRAKVPKNKGTWPAIWLLGRNVNEPGAYFSSTYGTTDWPACGEIDMMEYGIFPSAPDNFIQSTLHTPSSYGGSVNHGGTLADSDISENFHIYSMNWSPYQITFLLDGVAYYTYNPANKNASTWPFDKEQFLLLNIAMGGVAGNIPSDFSAASMEIDYVRVYQNTTPDTAAPFNFTASVGAVMDSSVELLLNASDLSGNVVYTVTGGANQTVAASAGTQKSVIISGLVPNTSYNFNVSVSDLSGNAAANNPIQLSATTTVSSSNACSGTSSEASQGSFSTGYKYNFETLGTDVKITFELLDSDKTGVVAYLWQQSPFTEVQMINTGGKTFTQTISNQTAGSTINYAVKFAYAGGMSVTKYFSYIVGNTCKLGSGETV